MRSERVYVRRPVAEFDLDDVRLCWASHGEPASLDPVAAAVLDCFDEPATVGEVTADVADVVGLPGPQAHHAVRGLVDRLGEAGLLAEVESSASDPDPDPSLFYPRAPTLCLLSKVPLATTDRIVVEIGGSCVSVASQTAQLRTLLSDSDDEHDDPRMAPLALLLGRPGADDRPLPSATPAWVLYESGDVVLRRSTDEVAVCHSAVFHLAALRHALTGTLLPLRMRTLILASGEAVLVEPALLMTLAGHDRRLARQEVTVLPTTAAAVEAATGTLVLPDQTIDPAVPTGHLPIARIVVPDWLLAHSPLATAMLWLARSVIRMAETDLDAALADVARLVASGVSVEPMGHATVAELLASGEWVPQEAV